MTFKGIVTVIRVPFLILALILGILGSAVAWYESIRYGSPFNIWYAILATFGLLIAHAAVNIFNDYSMPVVVWIIKPVEPLSVVAAVPCQAVC